jgi:hypothetical protein
MDVRLSVQQLPQALGTMAGQSVLDLHAAAELLNILLGVQARYTLPALVVGRGSEGHYVAGLLMCQRVKARLSKLIDRKPFRAVRDQKQECSN